MESTKLFMVKGPAFHIALVYSLTLMIFVTIGHNALAFTATDRDAAWSAWTNAYYYVAADGRGYIRVKEANNSQVSFWQLAEEIEMVEDATCYPGVQTNMVNALCSGFTNLYGVNWSWNTYNDDLMWASMAFSRAYLLTGNTTYRTLAKNGFDLGYSRGWDPVDGGIFQNTSDTNPKCTCGNGSAAVAAYMLYQSLNDASYKTKAQGIYGWMVTNVFDPATGAVMEGPGTGNYFTYDSGMFVTIAFWLGDTNYAYKAGDWVTNHWGVGMQSFGPGSDGGGMNGICLRGLARTGHNIAFLQSACDNGWSWRNSRNLTTCHWYNRTPDDQSLYSNDTYSHIAGMLCLPTGAPLTLPVTATDVVGSDVSFSAILGGHYSYQWKLIRSGVTNNISGATNTTLILSNLQLTNAGSYFLQASNATEVITSTPATLTVNSVPGAVNNVVARFAAQTGTGYGNWLTPTWSIASGSVIQGQFPIVTNGNFDQETNWGDRVVSSLTAGGSLTVTPGGSPTTTSTNYVACGSSAGTALIYSLTNNSPGGYFLTNITVYGGWKDAGRDQQAYTIYYSTVSAPTTFILIRSVNFNPVNSASVPSATRVMLTPTGSYLATNVAAVKFDFTSPSPENGYCGYAGIGLYGIPANPILLTDTIPATAVEAVGGAVEYRVGVSGMGLAYQWQKVSGGVTNDITGASGPTLTVNNLQFSDAASYQLRVTNNYGVVYSTARPLTVTSMPAPVNNVITCYAAQTGLGGSTDNFYTTWTLNTGSLIAGMVPSSVGSGDFSEPTYHQCGTVAVLTDGDFGYLRNLPGNGSSPTEVACGSGAGQSVIYTLPASIYGYNLTNITVYGGWGDEGRDQQAYTIYYSKVTAPGTFMRLSSANYNPSNPMAVQSATRAVFSPVVGALATNVTAVKFDFTSPSPENGYCGYSEIQVYGYENIPAAVATSVSAVMSANGGLVMSIGGMVVNRNYEIQSSTNLVPPVLWNEESNFKATTTSTIITNAISGSDQKFYRVLGY